MVWYRLPKAGLRVRCTRRLGFAKASHSIRHVLRAHESLRIGIPGMVHCLAWLVYFTLPPCRGMHRPAGGHPPLLFLILPFYSVSTDLFWPAFCSRQSIAIFPYIRAPWSCWPGPQSLFPSSPSTSSSHASSLFGLAGSFCSGLRCGHPPCALAYVRTADIAEATNGHLRRLCRGAVRGIFLGTASRHHFQEKRTLLLTRRTLVLDRSTK